MMLLQVWLYIANGTNVDLPTESVGIVRTVPEGLVQIIKPCVTSRPILILLEPLQSSRAQILSTHERQKPQSFFEVRL